MNDDNIPTEVDFEKLFVNNDKLGEIQAYLNRFNPIRVMKMEDMEIRHSSILGWLMTPRETHGLGDQFLKAFLANALSERSDYPTANDIKDSDLSGALVDIEKQNIDIFVLCQEQKWAFIIENKYRSNQHSDQLKRYRVLIQEQFGRDFSVFGIFLTLNHEEPEDDNYAATRYDSICRIIDEMQLTKDWKVSCVDQEVRLFIEHYLDVLKRKTGMDEKLKEVKRRARELYMEHRNVLKFVVDHGELTEFEGAIMDIFRKQGKDDPEQGRISLTDGELGECIRFGYLTPRSFDFLPKSWYDNFLKMEKTKYIEDIDENYGKVKLGVNCPFSCWINLSVKQNGSGKVTLHAQLGPYKDKSLRGKIKDDLNGIGNDWIKVGKTDRFTQFVSTRRLSESIDDVTNMNKITEATVKLIKKSEGVFASVNKMMSEKWLRLPSPTATETDGSR